MPHGVQCTGFPLGHRSVLTGLRVAVDVGRGAVLMVVCVGPWPVLVVVRMAIMMVVVMDMRMIVRMGVRGAKHERLDDDGHRLDVLQLRADVDVVEVR